MVPIARCSRPSSKPIPLVRIFLAERGSATWLALIVVSAVSGPLATGQFGQKRFPVVVRIARMTFLWLLVVGIRQPWHLRSPAAQSQSGVVYDQSDRQRNRLLRDFQSALRVKSSKKNEFTALKAVTQLPVSGSSDGTRSPRLLLRTVNSPMTAPIRWCGRLPHRAATKPLNVVFVVMESFTGRLTGCLAECRRFRRSWTNSLQRVCFRTLLRDRRADDPGPGSGGVFVSATARRRGGEASAGPAKFRHFGECAARARLRDEFFYGGQGIFDHMLAFFIGNGFDRFIEEKDFAAPVYKSPWGVSDEDLFMRAEQEFRRLHVEGNPFFATILTVSLHSPWQYPAGRIMPLAADTKVPHGFELAELNNFLYADYCIGKFISDGAWFSLTSTTRCLCSLAITACTCAAVNSSR